MEKKQQELEEIRQELESITEHCLNNNLGIENFILKNRNEFVEKCKLQINFKEESLKNILQVLYKDLLQSYKERIFFALKVCEDFNGYKELYDDINKNLGTEKGSYDNIYRMLSKNILNKKINPLIKGREKLMNNLKKFLKKEELFEELNLLNKMMTINIFKIKKIMENKVDLKEAFKKAIKLIKIGETQLDSGFIRLNASNGYKISISKIDGEVDYCVKFNSIKQEISKEEFEELYNSAREKISKRDIEFIKNIFHL